MKKKLIAITLLAIAGGITTNAVVNLSEQSVFETKALLPQPQGIKDCQDYYNANYKPEFESVGDGLYKEIMDAALSEAQSFCAGASADQEKEIDECVANYKKFVDEINACYTAANTILNNLITIKNFDYTDEYKEIIKGCMGLITGTPDRVKDIVGDDIRYFYASNSLYDMFDDCYQEFLNMLNATEVNIEFDFESRFNKILKYAKSSYSTNDGFLNEVQRQLDEMMEFISIDITWLEYLDVLEHFEYTEEWKELYDEARAYKNSLPQDIRNQLWEPVYLWPYEKNWDEMAYYEGLIETAKEDLSEEDLQVLEEIMSEAEAKFKTCMSETDQDEWFPYYEDKITKILGKYLYKDIIATWEAYIDILENFEYTPDYKQAVKDFYEFYNSAPEGSYEYIYIPVYLPPYNASLSNLDQISELINANKDYLNDDDMDLINSLMNEAIAKFKADLSGSQNISIKEEYLAKITAVIDNAKSRAQREDAIEELRKYITENSFYNSLSGAWTLFDSYKQALMVCDVSNISLVEEEAEDKIEELAEKLRVDALGEILNRYNQVVNSYLKKYPGFLEALDNFMNDALTPIYGATTYTEMISNRDELITYLSNVYNEYKTLDDLYIAAAKLEHLSFEDSYKAALDSFVGLYALASGEVKDMFGSNAQVYYSAVYVYQELGNFMETVVPEYEDYITAEDIKYIENLLKAIGTPLDGHMYNETEVHKIVADTLAEALAYLEACKNLDAYKEQVKQELEDYADSLVDSTWTVGLKTQLEQELNKYLKKIDSASTKSKVDTIKKEALNKLAKFAPTEDPAEKGCNKSTAIIVVISLVAIIGIILGISLSVGKKGKKETKKSKK